MKILPFRIRGAGTPTPEMQETIVGEGFIPSRTYETYLSNDSRTDGVDDLLEPVLELLPERQMERRDFRP
jgi:hypothetical protein